MKYFVILSALALVACSHVEPVVKTKTTFVAVKISDEFLDPNKCPWPDPDAYIVNGTNVEAGEWIVAGKNAWTCEHLTRGKIKEQNEQQARDIEARNKK